MAKNNIYLNNAFILSECQRFTGLRVERLKVIFHTCIPSFLLLCHIRCHFCADIQHLSKSDDGRIIEVVRIYLEHLAYKLELLLRKLSEQVLVPRSRSLGEHIREIYPHSYYRYRISNLLHP